jgi:hypothetical protein
MSKCQRNTTFMRLPHVDLLLLRFDVLGRGKHQLQQYLNTTKPLVIL